MAPANGISSTTPIKDRLLACSMPVPWSGCWIWLRALSGSGYGYFHASDGSGQKPTMRSAHRESYKCFVGPIPPGLQLDHLCRNRACINPAHLEPVTGQENSLRGINLHRIKTHCPQGHPYTPGNLRADPKHGRRLCLTCHRIRERNRRRKAGVTSLDEPQKPKSEPLAGTFEKPAGDGNAKSTSGLAI